MQFGKTKARQLPCPSLAGDWQASRQLLVHNAPDRAGAASALRPAAQRVIDLAGWARACSTRKPRAHVVVGEHVAGADNHETWTPYPTIMKTRSGLPYKGNVDFILGLIPIYLVYSN